MTVSQKSQREADKQRELEDERNAAPRDWTRLHDRCRLAGIGRRERLLEGGMAGDQVTHAEMPVGRG